MVCFDGGNTIRLIGRGRVCLRWRRQPGEQNTKKYFQFHGFPFTLLRFKRHVHVSSITKLFSKRQLHNFRRTPAQRHRCDIFVVCKPKQIQAPSGAAYPARLSADVAPDGACSILFAGFYKYVSPDGLSGWKTIAV
jgi:hypothetical protein